MMDWRTLPPLTALRAFAAFAQTGSVVQAGAALNVTHAAISQQIRALEEGLGLALVDRAERRLRLTEDGARLARALNDGFGTIADCLADLTGAAQTRPLHVASTPSFAASWLMPRLGRFRAAHPDLDLLINPSPALTDPRPGGVDVALRYGLGTWPGLECAPLVVAPLVVVAAPSLVAERRIETPQDLLDLPWLQEPGHDETQFWLQRQGVTAPRRASLTQLPGHLLLDGLRAGQGVAVTSLAFVADDLEHGRLLRLFQDDAPRGYHICTLPGPMRPALRAFVRWLKQEAVAAKT